MAPNRVVYWGIRGNMEQTIGLVEAQTGSLSHFLSYVCTHILGFLSPRDISFINFTVFCSMNRSKKIAFADDFGAELSQSTYVADLHYSSGTRMNPRKPGRCCVVSWIGIAMSVVCFERWGWCVKCIMVHGYRIKDQAAQDPGQGGWGADGGTSEIVTKLFLVIITIVLLIALCRVCS